MRAVVQRVKKASVKEKGKIKASVKRGLLLYLAIGQEDTSDDVSALVEKVAKLRIFAQKNKVHDFQQSIKDIKGEILVIPNYTLYGDLSEGNRPYFGDAASPGDAKPLYEEFLEKLGKALKAKTKVKTGTFGEFMNVSAVNDGPATLILETALMEDDSYINGGGELSDDYSENFDDFLDKMGIDLLPS